LSDWFLIIKRIFDILGAGIGLFMLSPAMLLIALVVVLDSRGPAFYHQQRVGRHGQLFTFWKFRSMYTHLSMGKNYGGHQAEQVETQLDQSDANVRDNILSKIENDPRVTRV
jgi:lipopolysaccharide/colanic/teichoic acid biosynthesis glycosyltransferase